MKRVIGEVRLEAKVAAVTDMNALIKDVREIGELIVENDHLRRAYIYKGEGLYYPLRVLDCGDYFKCHVDFTTLVTPEPDEWHETWFIHFQPKPPREVSTYVPDGKWDPALLRACKPFKEVPF